MNKLLYQENFEDGPGGWHTWISNDAGPGKLDIQNGVVRFQSPWWVDYNHAPPGAGYLHLTMALRLRENSAMRHADSVAAVAGPSRFASQFDHPDLRGATFTLRLRGDLAMRGASLMLLIQSRVADRWVNYVLAAQPFAVSPTWSTQSVVLDPDPEQWVCLGSRCDRGETYGEAPIDQVLADANGNLILVLFPLDIVPLDGGINDPHALRAGEDYAVRQELLPEGYVEYDGVSIQLVSDTAAIASVT